MPDTLLTLPVQAAMQKALRDGMTALACSLDLQRSVVTVDLGPGGWSREGSRYPWIEKPKDRTIYRWTGDEWAPVQRFSDSRIKLVPTQWGTPVFEIDGIKMLVSEKVSPWEDAKRKVALVEPRGKTILDTCGGLGYFAAWCLESGASRIQSFEKNPDVVWLRSLNPWSPATGGALSLTEGDVSLAIASLPDQSFDAILHDPPRFGIAGELYSQAFYDQLARVIRRKGKLFHYTGSPNKLTSGRDVPAEVSKRLKLAGFSTELAMDGVLGKKN